MKRLLTALLTITLIASLASPALAQDTTIRHRSGARRQLATIVFAGLGGAILGLSTLSFYGRPQDHLSNIAVGFAIGVIAGTAYVTVRSATTRDYFNDSPPPQSRLNLPVHEVAPENEIDPEPESKMLWAPLVARVSPDSSAKSIGGQMLFRF
jgi:hypothetical protein